MSKIIPIDEEYHFNNSIIISQTNLRGIITYANRAFCDISDYSVNELVGRSHNIIRHPDMPKVVFAKMWETISGGQVWNGLVKNLRKDGKFYWVDTEILPIKDDNHTVIGYIAARKEASQKNIEETKNIYKQMLETEKSRN